MAVRAMEETLFFFGFGGGGGVRRKTKKRSGGFLRSTAADEAFFASRLAWWPANVPRRSEKSHTTTSSVGHPHHPRTRTRRSTRRRFRWGAGPMGATPAARQTRARRVRGGAANGVLRGHRALVTQTAVALRHRKTNAADDPMRPQGTRRTIARNPMKRRRHCRPPPPRPSRHARLSCVGVQGVRFRLVFVF